jgi:very-short-patch-repair endonuclease
MKPNSIKLKAPHLEAGWHPTKNGDVKFEDVSFANPKNYWWICPKGHEWPAHPNSRTAMKSGCPHCSSSRSKAELAIYAIVKEKYPDAKSGKKGLLQNKNFELDVYIPLLRKAIEYDGTYWHSDPDRVKLDRKKDEQCLATGIQLLRIPEAEYEADRPSTVQKILDFLAAPRVR